ncbi:hypothetical protein OH686_14065 [Pseudomonas sp. SO81]|nr:hypothetical protein OH686_14065 [Pseudomonas sp. SO81]
MNCRLRQALAAASPSAPQLAWQLVDPKAVFLSREDWHRPCS